MTGSQFRDIRTPAPIVIRGAFPTFAFTYLRLPPWSALDAATTSVPYAIDFAFTASRDATIERLGRTERRDVPALSGGAVGQESFRWLRTRSPSEVVEIRPGVTLREQIADSYRRSAADAYRETYGQREPFLFVLASRLRAHALGGRALSDLESEALVNLAVETTIEREGARRRFRTGTKLDSTRMRRVQDYVQVHLEKRLTLAELADVAAVSPDHFALMFRRAASDSPHRYVTALRMQRAREVIEAGGTVDSAASSVGYASAHHFRAEFRRAHGVLPGALRQSLRCDRS